MSEERNPEIPSDEIFERLLHAARSGFRCLRSGRCCRTQMVEGVPGYDNAGEWTGDLSQRGLKRDFETCRHLEPAQVVNGVWQRAWCNIHDDPLLYPPECKDFFVGFGACEIGIAQWKARKQQHPQAKLPDEVRDLLK